jgi:hypothetical protein
MAAEDDTVGIKAFTLLHVTAVPTEGNDVDDDALREATRDVRAGPAHRRRTVKVAKMMVTAGQPPAYIFVPLCVCGPCAPAIAVAEIVEVRVPCESADAFAALAHRQHADDWTTSIETAPAAKVLGATLNEYLARPEDSTDLIIWHLTFGDDSVSRWSIAGAAKVRR